jgi:RNA polymerase sigma factor (sigma-70 family)
MHDARDAEDNRLLAAGEIALLLESYYGVIIDRCQLKLRDPGEAVDVAHEVTVRLLAELKRGRRYRVPFRVVVHQVIKWKLQEHFQSLKADDDLDAWLWRVSAESEEPLDADAGFEALLEGLTELEQTVLRLRYDDDLDFPEIAQRLGKTPNAIHQRHHGALEKLRARAA